MIGYKTLFIHKEEDFDICIEFNTLTYECDWYYREYNHEFDSVCKFDKL